jgi:hypothetical protein
MSPRLLDHPTPEFEQAREALRGEGLPSTTRSPTTSEAIAERDDALARVDQAADADWQGEAILSFRRLVERGEPFTTDDVWDDLADRDVPGPREPRALGPVTRRLLGLGLIEPVEPQEWRPSRRRHMTPIRVYRSGRNAR